MTTPKENVQWLLLGATTNQTSPVFVANTGETKTLIASVTGTGSVAGTVAVQVSADEVNWITAATLTLSGTTSDMAQAALVNSAPFWRAVLSGISGTGATVNCALCGN